MSVAELVAVQRSKDEVVEPFKVVRPLGSLLPPVPAMPAALLPLKLRTWIEDIADRMQVPLELVAAPAITAFAGVVGRKVSIHPKKEDDWLVVPNLWGLIVARPGKMKTPVLKEILRPIDRLMERIAEEDHDKRRDAQVRLDSLAEQEKVILAAIKKHHGLKEGKQVEDLEGLESQLGEVRVDKERLQGEVRFRRIVVNDTTTEKLGALLAENPWGLLLVRDEIAGWWRGLERDDRKSDRELYLEAWGGDGSFTFDRIGRGTVRIPALCLSVFGGTQPGKLSKAVGQAVNGGTAADGFLQRFQVMVWPEDLEEHIYVDRPPSEEARARAFEAFEMAAALEPGETEVRRVYRFDDEAQELFQAWYEDHESKIRGSDLANCPALESHLAKYRSLMPSLALLFHLLDSVSTSDRVGLECARRAADWCEFLEEHARKVYAPEVHPGRRSAHALLAKIKKGKVVAGMTVRDVYTSGWTDLNKAEQVHAAFDVLEEHGIARVATLKTNGRPSAIVQVNPVAILESVQ